MPAHTACRPACVLPPFPPFPPFTLRVRLRVRLRVHLHRVRARHVPQAGRQGDLPKGSVRLGQSSTGGWVVREQNMTDPPARHHSLVIGALCLGERCRCRCCVACCTGPFGLFAPIFVAGGGGGGICTLSWLVPPRCALHPALPHGVGAHGQCGCGACIAYRHTSRRCGGANSLLAACQLQQGAGERKGM